MVMGSVICIMCLSRGILMCRRGVRIRFRMLVVIRDRDIGMSVATLSFGLDEAIYMSLSARVSENICSKTGSRTTLSLPVFWQY